MLNIILSYDYELFLGENYDTPQKVLFAPTDDIIRTLDKYNIPCTLFADVCSVYAHKKFGLQDYIDHFSNQLVDVKKKGHDVQLHLHPNWYLSKYINGKWVFDTTHYTLHKFCFGENSDCELTAGKIIEDGIEFLSNLLLPICPDYKVNTFRAGGYSIQPHSVVVELLRKKGIIVDSSVCSNLYSSSNTLSYDFKKLPQRKNWWITPNCPFTYCGRMDDGGVYEIPLLSEKNSLFKKLFLSGYDEKFRTSSLKGSFIALGEQKRENKGIIKKIRLYKSSFSLVSFDSMPARRMIDYFLSFEKKCRNKDIYVSVIGHPKMFDDGVLKNMETIIERLHSNKNIKFCTFQDVVNLINEGVIE